MAMNFILQNFD